MTGYLWPLLAFLGGLAMTALGDMVSEEVRDRLDHLPYAILRLAARRLDPQQHITIYQDEWPPELTYILKGPKPGPSPASSPAPDKHSASSPTPPALSQISSGQPQNKKQPSHQWPRM